MSKQKKKKETGRELNGSLDRSLLFWFSTNRNGFIRFQFNGSSLVDIEFRVRSVVFFDLHDRSETRSSSSRKQAHEILMTVTIFFTTLTLNGLTLEFIPKNASSNKGGGRLRCLKCLTEFKCITKYEYNSVHLTAGIYHCLSNTVYI